MTDPATTPAIPGAGALHLSIEGDEVTLTGTEKGNSIHRQLVPRPWVWSRHAAGYVLPRSLLPLTRHRHVATLIAAATAAGIELQVDDDEQAVSEAERRQGRTARLEIRAEGHEVAAARAAATSTRSESARRLLSEHIPPGQPILVGHHSERGHRRALARLDRLDRQALDADRTAARRAELAEGIRQRLDRGDSPVTIRLRIERHEAEIRRLSRELGDRTGHRLNDERDRLGEAVEIDRATLAQMEAEGRTVTYGPHNVAVGDIVQCGTGWHRVHRVNAKSVTVPSSLGPWTDTLPYAKITGHRAKDGGAR